MPPRPCHEPPLRPLQHIAPGLASTHRRQYVLCTTPLHAGCDKDEDFSTHYGQPVYVCKI